MMPLHGMRHRQLTPSMAFSFVGAGSCGCVTDGNGAVHEGDVNFFLLLSAKPYRLLPNFLKDRSWANLMLGQAPIIVFQLRQEAIPMLERA
jgi:hypothetical protein